MEERRRIKFKFQFQKLNLIYGNDLINSGIRQMRRRKELRFDWGERGSLMSHHEDISSPEDNGGDIIVAQLLFNFIEIRMKSVDGEAA